MSEDTIGSHLYRYKELLFRIHLKADAADKAIELFQWLQKNVHKTGFPILKTRLHIYALYIAIITGKDIIMRKLHYNLNKEKRENLQITLPFLIGKVIYHLQRDDLQKAELEFTHLRNYTKIYLQTPVHDRSIAFVSCICLKMNPE